MTKQEILGLWGEAQIADYLKTLGYRILETRWRCRFGEIDLIAVQDSFLCFVEVKLRKDDSMAPARAFVTPAKQKRIRISAALYLTEHPSRLQPRLDVAEIYAPYGINTKKPNIIYLENAF
ncbi:MAG: YraN family protein [Evtepia sp.]